MAQKTIIYIFGAVLFLGLLNFFLMSPPGRFPVNGTVTIEQGSSVSKVSEILKTSQIIRSEAAFKFFVIITGGEKRIRPGSYNFDKPIPVFIVAWRVSARGFKFSQTTVTIPEGFDSEEIAEAFEKKLLNFDKKQFLALASGRQGRLFPDTYFFLSTDGAAEAFEALTENYDQKMSLFREGINVSGRTENEILTMASIIEGEASGELDRALIAGILWKRFEIDMPLQADAAPITYKEKGLPKEPISNPGVKAIEAALFPETSPYLYYLHDPEGNIHYAKNFAEHLSNKRQYLK